MRYLLLVMAWLLFVAPPLHAALPDECGDADASGTITVTDGVAVLRTAAALVGGCTVTSRCDSDGNGAVSITDGVNVLRLAASLPAVRACRHVVIDRSVFATFQFHRRRAFGFCPPLDRLASAVLFRSGDTIQFSGSVYAAGTSGVDDCLDGVTTVPEVPCPIEVAVPARILDADEVAAVDAAFASIAIEQQRDPACALVTLEPCLIDEFDWDARPLADFACSEPRLLAEEVVVLGDLLESLR